MGQSSAEQYLLERDGSVSGWRGRRLLCIGSNLRRSSSGGAGSGVHRGGLRRAGRRVPAAVLAAATSGSGPSAVRASARLPRRPLASERARPTERRRAVNSGGGGPIEVGVGVVPGGGLPAARVQSAQQRTVKHGAVRCPGFTAGVCLQRLPQSGTVFFLEAHIAQFLQPPPL